MTDPTVPRVWQVVGGIHFHPVSALLEFVLRAFKDGFRLLFGLHFHNVLFSRRFLFLACPDVIVLVPVHGRLGLARQQVAFELR